jgi:very-short-patch-repair endonuclease
VPPTFAHYFARLGITWFSENRKDFLLTLKVKKGKLKEKSLEKAEAILDNAIRSNSNMNLLENEVKKRVEEITTNVKDFALESFSLVVELDEHQQVKRVQKMLPKPLA